MKKILITGVIIVFVILIGYMVYNYSNNAIKAVNLNKEIIMEKNETVKLENEEVYLTLKRFVNSPAPDGAIAIWSGLAVIYELEIDNHVYRTNDVGILEEQETIPYSVKIIESDYKTFAKIKIIENAEN